MHSSSDNAQITVEHFERVAPDQQSQPVGIVDFTARLRYERARGKKRKPQTVQLHYRFSLTKLTGKFTSWPKKWDTEIRGDLESRLSHLALAS